jgi:hypothetical protein
LHKGEPFGGFSRSVTALDEAAVFDLCITVLVFILTTDKIVVKKTSRFTGGLERFAILIVYRFSRLE